MDEIQRQLNQLTIKVDTLAAIVVRYTQVMELAAEALEQGTEANLVAEDLREALQDAAARAQEVT